MKRSGWIILIFWIFVISHCHLVLAEDINKQAAPSFIKVQVGKVTEIDFPCKIAKIIKGGPQDSILVEVLESSLYVLPKLSQVPDIFVTTIDGASYPLSFQLSEEHDIKISVGSIKGQKETNSNGYYHDVMELMKDLLLDKQPVGATSLPANVKMHFSDGKIELTLYKVYELMGWKAYILLARNISDNAVIIPLEQISFPHLLAVSSERDMLFAKGEEGDHARVYLIAGQKDE